MALFNNNPRGGIMDAIRCDDTEHLIWKWRPAGASPGDSARDNSIRCGSTLRVKNGQVAVVQAQSKSGGMVQDFIRGPYDSVLHTENLPVISSAIGLAYNGTAPFQAEVYFINLANIIQMEIGVPYFNVFDKNYEGLSVKTAVRGVLTFRIADYEDFISKYQLREISIEELKKTIKPAAIKYITYVVSNASDEYGIPITQLHRRNLDISDIIEKRLKDRLFNEFGVTVSSFDISAIEVDETCPGYKMIMKQSGKDYSLNGGLGRATKATEQAVGIFNNATSRLTGSAAESVAGAFSKLAGTATSAFVNAAAQVGEVSTDIATAAVDVNEYQYAKHKKTQAGFVRSLIRGGGDLSDDEKKPRFSSKFSKNVSGLANGIGAKKKATTEDDDVPPSLPNFSYRVAIDGRAAGPFDLNGLVELFKSGKLTPDSLVWTKGMPDWVKAGDIEDFAVFFEEDDDEAPPLPPIL